MICDECKKRPAVMHYTSIVNGVKTEYDFCQECAKKLGVSSFSPFSWGDVFPHAVSPAYSQTKCGQCGMTMAEFKQTGLLGCEQCYQDLKKGIEPILKRVQKELLHTGRTPMGFEAAKLPKPGDTVREQTQGHEPTQEEILTAQLREAIRKEDFEQAAVLRDQIRDLQTVQSLGDSAKEDDNHE